MGFMDIARGKKEDASSRYNTIQKENNIQKDNIIPKDNTLRDVTPKDPADVNGIRAQQEKLMQKPQGIDENPTKSDSVPVYELVTIFDKVVDEIRSGNKKLLDISRKLNSKKEDIERLFKILEKQGIIDINYPVNFMSSISAEMRPVNEKIERKFNPKGSSLLDEYVLESDGVVSRIRIWNHPLEDTPFYEISLPRIGIGTRAFMDHIIDLMAKESPIDSEKSSDPDSQKSYRDSYILAIGERIKGIIPMDEKSLTFIRGRIAHEMLGLGDIEIILVDNWLEEVAINGSKVPLSVYHKRFGWTRTNFWIESEEEIYNLSSQIGRKVGRQINSLNPLMDAHLSSGDRIAATLDPISSNGNTITIRRFSRNPWTIIHLIESGTLSKEIAAFLWLCVQYELNIMVAGGTASGKTSVLNSICSLIPSTQRILSIEDTREISLPNDLHWNWVPLSSRKANPEGQGEVSMLDLMVESLRMRPDRIIVGEIRRREQAETLFETMHTGHSVYATMHADTVEQVERRLIEPPIEIPKTEIGALQLIIVQYRDRRKGKRRTLEVAEILSQETDNKNLSINYLFRWKPRTDTFEKVNESIRVMEDLNLHTGMTSSDLDRELKGKEAILDWMVRHKVKNVDKVGAIMKLYYKNQDVVLNSALRDEDPEKLLLSLR